MYRTNNCGELRLENVGQKVTLAGWVQKSRKLGGMTFIDLRDRYGITQLVCDDTTDKSVYETAKTLSREYVIQVKGLVRERSSKNNKIPTGDIEIEVKDINVLTTYQVFTVTSCYHVILIFGCHEGVKMSAR